MRKAKQDGQSWITRTAVLTLLAGFIASLGGFEAAAQDAQESPSYHGTMATSYGPNTIGPSIYDTDLKELLDKFIPTYQSTLLIFTQCYSGDFSDEFSGRENTATLTATSPGQIAYYGGYEDDAASALRPGEGRTSDDVHQAGTDGKREAETPTKSGSAVSLEDTSAEGPIKSRHVLFYAGQPDSLPDRDVDQRNEMDNNFKDKLNTSFTSVGGNPDSEGNGTDGWDYPGNFDGLKAALMEIGKQMSKDEQFILFVSDHGDRHKAFEDFDLGIDATVSITLNMDTILLEDMLIDTGNEEGVGVTFHVLPTVTFDFDQLLAGNLTVELQETNAVNNAPVHQKIDLDDPDAPTGEGKSSRLFFPFAEADLIPW